MKRIKIAITLITMVGILLGTASIASAQSSSSDQQKMIRIQSRLGFMLLDRPLFNLNR